LRRFVGGGCLLVLALVCAVLAGFGAYVKIMAPASMAVSGSEM
jgi:hypothetical protein